MTSEPVSSKPELLTAKLLELREVLREVPQYQALWADEEFLKQGNDYMRWVASLNGEGHDSTYIVGSIDDGITTFDMQMDLFHEYIEFYNWMRLGHELQDIMTLKYYQDHYLEVYPTAHCNAIVAEETVWAKYAHRNGLNPLKMVALYLVNPANERRSRLANSAMPMMVRGRLRFNRNYFFQPVSTEDVETAFQAYALGDYTYRDEQNLRDRAKNFTMIPVADRLSELQLPEVTECQSLAN